MNKKRPRPQTLIQYEAQNFYAVLGVSPLASAKEIKGVITKKQNEANNRRNITQDKATKEANFIKLQKIAKKIGSEEDKQQYDRAYPHNELLTVQLGENEIWMNKMVQVNFVSTWLLDVLDEEVFLPTPTAIPLWIPKGIDAELLAFLAKFKHSETEAHGKQDNGLSLEDLDEIVKQ